MPTGDTVSPGRAEITTNKSSPNGGEATSCVSEQCVFRKRVVARHQGHTQPTLIKAAAKTMPISSPSNRLTRSLRANATGSSRS
jgi:hypothetical protein